MKLDWKKDAKQLYLPSGSPVAVTVPAMNFFSIEGAGDPNGEAFGGIVSALYSLAYGVKMSPKSGFAPSGYREFAVYPLEGLWDLSQAGRKKASGDLDKSELVFKIMIRQPDFVTDDFAREVIERVLRKKPTPALAAAKFETITDGTCVQMLHIGSYDAEPASFAKMEEFCRASGFVRSSMTHREIYISDPGRTAPDRLKTVLRFACSLPASQERSDR